MENEFIQQIFSGILAIIVILSLLVACVVIIYLGFRQAKLEDDYLKSLSDEELVIINKYNQAKRITSENAFPKKENKHKEE